MKKVVIIGGVAGGASCAARLRRLDEEAEIIILERGEYISYANCGLPYHVGDVIKSRDALLLQTPEAMRKKFKIDVRVKNEAVAIDRGRKTVRIKRVETGESYEESYDVLVIATGSSPMRPPIPGIDSSRIKTLWTVPDTDSIRALIKEKNVKKTAVIGGGFIGLEMAENLRLAGTEVSVIEAADQVMAPLDYEMAQLLHENIRQNGVNLHLGDGVASFSEENEKVTVTLKSGKTEEADLVILSIGVRPNSEIAGAAGLALGERGGIVVDGGLKTSDPSIYAVGDVIEVEDFISKERTMVPLAGPANKQGRIAADNIAGAEERYEGTQGSSVAKVFDLTAASTGANEKTLLKRGLIRGKDYESIIITQNSHAGYYPGAVPMTMKLLFSADGKKIFGAQIVGRGGVDKRIDTLGVAMRLGAGIEDLKNLELAYAPPYSSAKDPVNMAGFVAENVINGLVAFSDWDVEHKHPDAVLLDVREDAELMAFSVPHAVHIPLGQLRDRLGELDRSKEIIVFCAIGVRAYNASRILSQHGFDNVKVYPSGARFYQSLHPQAEAPMFSAPGTVYDSGREDTSNVPTVSMRVDCSGMQCPGPIMKVFETMKGMKDGEVMEVSASDPGFARDIGAWCRRTGNTLVSNGRRGSDYVACVKKSSAPVSVVKDTPEGKTIIVFSGDLDKVLASFIIANGAAAMGRPVTMFFTFWGLTALRKENKQPVKKTFMESMFGSMLPRGSKKLKLSRMNMGGMGTAMMKKIMNDKSVDSLETMIQKAMRAGVKIVACTMSMDVMGIKEEELIDGVQLGGVGAYLGDAEESNVNLFI
jgi:NADPH-dependent 2,4-dienoyl-CoA reductase/sulfur reductase-like enzyme/peroxiredoxin family protein/TusA-related sulfurtransferase/rhodanese-related sulfurtransferase